MDRLRDVDLDVLWIAFLGLCVVCGAIVLCVGMITGAIHG